MNAMPAGRPVDAAGDDACVRPAVAAIEQFSVHGFHGTTTRDISRAAGMSPAALYIHHRSKEEPPYAISLYGHGPGATTAPPPGGAAGLTAGGGAW